VPKSRKRPSPRSTRARSRPAARAAKSGTASLFRLRGPLADGAQESVLKRATPGGEKPLVDIDVKAEFRPASRGIAPEQSIAVAPDDVLEIEFTDGTRTWLRGDEYRARFGGAAARDVGSVDLEVPTSLAISPAGASSRGAIGWVLKSLKVLGVDVHARTALALAASVEKRKGLRRPGFGLYRCALETGRFQLAPCSLPTKAADERPYLVLLHGTLSSTWGSFGELWSPERARELELLKGSYGDRVLGFEHATLAVSPLQNALDLANALPVGATVHLISHSRGGLVGELLCRSQSRASAKGRGNEWRPADPFSADEVGLLASQSRLLGQLNQLLQRRSLRTARFARVACPALGTTLASQRLDRWFSLIGSVASKALPQSPIAEVAGDIGDFIAAVIKERTDPKTLPGVEAMMPESPFIKLVNWPTAVVAGELYVIAGDLEPDAWWAKLLVWVTDRFYSGGHDLVVNTASMYGGAKRTDPARGSFFEGPAVNHFNYFRNSDSAARMVAAMARGESTGFQEFEPKVVDIARAIEVRDATPRPTVFMLPGIMGSELGVKQDRIWFDIGDLLLGGMEKLAIGVKNVQPLQPFARYYGDLLQFLATSHRVIPFAYDWRLDPRTEADRLAARIKEELPAAREQRQPIRILAHSMGGLVARTMIARHPDVWSQMLSIPGARLVMLGTPNGGSHSITELLVARSKTLRQLALLDVRNGMRGLLKVIARFPGVLAMLPSDPLEDYFDAAVWKGYADQSDGGWTQPAGADLLAARQVRQVLNDAAFDPQSMYYIAGHARATLCAMQIDAREKDPARRIQFDATNRGDGRVPWESGIPPGLKTWYMDVAHGDLSAAEDGFPAIVDVLAFGNTIRLATAPPVDRAAAEVFPMPRDVEVVYPDEPALQAEALGAEPTRTRRARSRRSQAVVDVRAVHGNLAFARFPVAVGHYVGDTIISAEKALDRTLAGQLSQRLQLGLYPGPIESSAVFVNQRLHSYDRVTPKGAVVVGLGSAGVLSASQLTQTFVHGLLEYVSEWVERGVVSVADEPDSLGISALLVGSGMGGVAVADSVAACLRAVAQANDILAASNQLQRIGEIEFIELWRDRAIQIVSAFARIEKDEPTLKGRFRFDGRLSRRKGARQRISYQEPGGWWHRIQILGEAVADSSEKVLRFSAITRRARNEVRLLTTQRTLVDGFIRQAIQTTQHEEQLARTLFELLLPNEFKDASLDEDNVVLMVDDESAAYPWELLEDPLEGRGPNDRQPFSCRRGVLRQLESLEFRENIQPSTSKEALVVGDPVSSFVELKGAQQEARAVARALDVSGQFRVTHLDRPSGTQVLKALFDRPYRVLHLAGHGVYEYAPATNAKDRVTGMVIGDGMFLTPHEIAQMRSVPELVFINCCHLGRITGEAPELANLRHDYNHIAANVAQEFIRMGVRAVIAAGWAVDDEAATAFAQSIYGDMLAGITFGQATRAARKGIYERYPTVNTWGAYQCYGDPDYRLVSATDGAATEPELNFATPEIAVTEIEDLTAQLETVGAADPSWYLGQLMRIEKWLQEQDWLSKPGVSISLARAYWEALRFQDALRFYRRALKEDSASLTLRDIEQLANLMTRLAVESTRHGGKPDQRAITDLFSEAEELLHWVTTPLMERKGAHALEPSNDQLTAERLLLLASWQKRRAWLSTDLGQTRRAIEKMREYYDLALSRRPPNDYYPRLNLIMGQVVTAWLASARAKRAGPAQQRRVIADLDAIARKIELLLRQGPDFLVDQARIDCKLLRCIAGDTLDDPLLNQLAGEYLDIRALSSLREFGSIRDQIDFLCRMATIGGRQPLVKSLQELLKRLNE
jgi:pimeloyl-ACP methyl ester carboxylesterase/tetratricopeptide (TPR) repeat protein